MIKRATFHVVPAMDGWVIKKNGIKKFLKNFTKKDSAIKFAKRLAKHAKLGQLIIHKKNGRIQTEYTYGADPRRTRG